MTREEKIQMMVNNYVRKRDKDAGDLILEFHHKHLFLFVNRFHQLLARFSTPSSSLLSHEIFLVVEAATIVAKSDWMKCAGRDAELYVILPKYFSAFDELALGIGSLNKAAERCIQALTTSNE
jgi:hypothetical protein